MHGLFAVRKPRGLTSAAAVAHVKAALLRALPHPPRPRMRLGHGGTLDPLASGVLVLGIGRATKLLHSDMLHTRKAYAAVACLGRATDTLDADGAPTAEGSYAHVHDALITRALQRFLGTHMQTPPLFSALKHNGVPLYRLARAGVDVDMSDKRRPVTIFALRCVELTLPYLRLEVECSRGTYVRSLIVDIAHELGTVGHMSELVRTRQGPFQLADALELGECSAATIAQAISRSERLLGPHNTS